MKSTIKALLISALLWMPITSTVFIAGCNSGCTTVGKAVAYKSLYIVASSTDAAMKAYADAVVAGKVPAATQAKVRDLHGRYGKALQAAVVAAHFDTSAVAPENLKALASELLTLITEVVK